MPQALPTTLEEFVRRKVDAGGFDCPEQVVQEALRLWDERERSQAQTAAKVAAGVDQLNRGEGTDYDEEELKQFFDELIGGVSPNGNKRTERN